MEANFKQWVCKVTFGRYRNTNGVAIQLVDALDGEPVATATVCIDGLQDDELAIKDYSENSGMLDCLMQADIVTAPHRVEQAGFCIVPIVRLTERAREMAL